jgi:hypothetical protein
LPRIPRPSAPPCLNPRVAPFPRSSGSASDRFFPGLPGLPRSSGSAEVRLPGSPRFFALSAAPSACFQGCPQSLPLGVAVFVRSRVAPDPARQQLVDDDSPLDSNFASAARAVDESSSQSGLAHSELGAPDAFPRFNLGLPLTGLPRLASVQDSNWLLHRPSKHRNCVPYKNWKLKQTVVY